MGNLLLLPVLLAIPTLIVGIVAGEWHTLPGLLVMVLLSLTCSQLLRRYGRNAPEGFFALPLIVAAMAWLVIALLGALPIYGAAMLDPAPTLTTSRFQDPINAVFESMSGFTSTGLTVADDPSTLATTVQWWRSLSQWVGAVGVVVLALVFIDPRESNIRLYEAEAREESVGGNTRTTVRRIWEIYLIYTAVVIGAFLLGGMNWWEAINHGMTALGTGGFTITSDSFQGYSALIKLVTIVAIILGATNFQVHHAVLSRLDWRFVFRQTQIRTFGILLLSGTALLAAIISITGRGTPFIDTIFQWVTAIGTCGFSSVALDAWTPAPLLILVVAMVIGGTAGSTVGGLKLARLAWLAKAVSWEFQQLWHQRSELTPSIRFNGSEVDRNQALERIRSAAALAVLWIIMLGVGSIILLLLLAEQRDFHEVLFEAASALGNVGLGIGIAEAELHPVGRITLVALMWMGRLEILAVLVLLSLPFEIASSGE